MVVMIPFVVDVDFAAIDDDQLFFIVVAGEDDLLRLIDAANQFEGDFVLEVDCEVGQEEDALLDDSDICLEYELLLEGTVDISQELSLLVVFQGSFLHFGLLLLNIALHLKAQLPTQVVMVSKLNYS